MPRATKGYIQRLLSGSFRVAVYARIDPITRQQNYFRATVPTETQAQIQLGKFIEMASEGRRP